MWHLSPFVTVLSDTWCFCFVLFCEDSKNLEREGKRNGFLDGEKNGVKIRGTGKQREDLGNKYLEQRQRAGRRKRGHRSFLVVAGEERMRKGEERMRKADLRELR